MLKCNNRIKTFAIIGVIVIKLKRYFKGLSVEVKKLYYSISEVSKITNLKQYVLRYWETEFSQLKPKKNNAGNRKYRKSDLKTINLIKDLLYNKKFTIEGARQYLAKKNDKSSTSIKDRKNILNEIKFEIEDILNFIKKNK